MPSRDAPDVPSLLDTFIRHQVPNLNGKLADWHRYFDTRVFKTYRIMFMLKKIAEYRANSSGFWGAFGIKVGSGTSELAGISDH